MFYNTGIATYIWVLSNRKASPPSGQGAAHRRHPVVQASTKEPGQQELRACGGGHSRICDVFLKFEETEQSKIFPNKAFGYWKVTVERPLRLEGIDPERVYTAKEIKALKQEGKRSETAPPVIKKVHKRALDADPLRGLFPARVKGKPSVVEYEPDTDLRDTEQVPLNGGGRH